MFRGTLPKRTDRVLTKAEREAVLAGLRAWRARFNERRAEYETKRVTTTPTKEIP